ncbi:DUF421 domain-containing protein [Paenibacillus chartarius]|uniref:DUF421 domain-containing protein n=1 Tax=Paenibacillus chartarius TaxID=747481 RepID=A0ABV6DFH1_9BACL
MIISGFILLRIAGKKIIAEMTPLEMVTILSIGTIIGHAVAENDIWQTVACIGIFVLIMVVFQKLALHIPFVERLLIGKPTMVVKDGQIQTKQLRKLRLTEDQLEMRIRQKGISRISDLRTATVEVNGRFGYELIDSARPVTRGELEELLSLLKINVELSKSQPAEVFDRLRE